jgi:hypothetical protein
MTTCLQDLPQTLQQMMCLLDLQPRWAPEQEQQLQLQGHLLALQHQQQAMGPAAECQRA